MSKADYPCNWEDIRKRILVRDSYTCQDCHKVYGVKYKRFLQIHHIVSINSGGNSRPSNLITLCYRCHSVRHPHMRSEEKVKAYNSKRNLSRIKTRKYR